MSIVLAFMLRNWRWFAGAGLAVTIALVVGLHFHKDRATQRALVKAEAEIGDLKKDNHLWQLAYHDEKRAVDLQNASIARMASDARAWEQRAQDATAAAHRANVKAQQSAAAFLAIKPKGATVCDRVEDVASRIREQVR